MIASSKPRKCSSPVMTFIPLTLAVARTTESTNPQPLTRDLRSALIFPAISAVSSSSGARAEVVFRNLSLSLRSRFSLVYLSVNSAMTMVGVKASPLSM